MERNSTSGSSLPGSAGAPQPGDSDRGYVDWGAILAGAAIAAGARDKVGDLPPVADFGSIQGRGVRGVVEGMAVVAGRASWLATDCAVTIPGELLAAADERMYAAKVGGRNQVRATEVPGVRALR